MGKQYPMDRVYQDEKTGGSVFCGGYQDAANAALLAQHNIGLVINVTDEPLPCTPGSTTASPIPGMRYVSWPIMAPGYSMPEMKNATNAEEEREKSIFADSEIPVAQAVLRARELQAAVDRHMGGGFFGKNPNNNVLIHCAYGIHRTGTAMVAYLMIKQHLTLEAALGLARAQRPAIDPGHFMCLIYFLRQLEAGLFGGC